MIFLGGDPIFSRLRPPSPGDIHRVFKFCLALTEPQLSQEVFKILRFSLDGTPRALEPTRVGYGSPEGPSAIHLSKERLVLTVEVEWGTGTVAVDPGKVLSRC